MTPQVSRRWFLGALPAAAAARRAFAQEPVQLRMSWWGGNDVHGALLATLRKFEARYPHIRVRGEYTGWAGHLERLTTQIAGHTAPDVMQINWNWLVLFSRDGRGFQDLRALSDRVDLTQFDADALATCTMAGHVNALPVAMTARLLYFNRSTFAKAQLALPGSWEELFAAGPEFRRRLGESYFPLDLIFPDAVALCRAWLVQRSGLPLIDERNRRLNATQSDLRDFAGLYERLVKAHVIPTARERASYGHVEQQEMRPWIDGRYAGTYMWTSAVGKSADMLAAGQHLGLAPYPMREHARDAGLLYRPAMTFAINARTPHRDASALLLNFLLNEPDAILAMGLKRGLPASRTAVHILRERGLVQGLALAGAEQIVALPNRVRESPYYEHARVRDGFNDILELLAYGRLDVDEAGRRLNVDIPRILERSIRT
jgi:oligogalacturonide transport system substrate-binding protein